METVEFLRIFGITVVIFLLSEAAPTTIVKKAQSSPISVLITTYSPNFVGLSFLILLVNIDFVCLANSDLIPQSSFLRQRAGADLTLWLVLILAGHLFIFWKVARPLAACCLLKEVGRMKSYFYRRVSLFVPERQLDYDERRQLAAHIASHTRSLWKRSIVASVGILAFIITILAYFGKAEV